MPGNPVVMIDTEAAEQLQPLLKTVGIEDQGWKYYMSQEWTVDDKSALWKSWQLKLQIKTTKY